MTARATSVHSAMAQAKDRREGYVVDTATDRARLQRLANRGDTRAQQALDHHQAEHHEGDDT